MRAAKIGKALRLISIFLLGEIGLWIMVLLNSHGLGFLWGLAMIPYSLYRFVK